MDTPRREVIAEIVTEANVANLTSKNQRDLHQRFFQSRIVLGVDGSNGVFHNCNFFLLQIRLERLRLTFPRVIFPTFTDLDEVLAAILLQDRSPAHCCPF